MSDSITIPIELGPISNQSSTSGAEDLPDDDSDSSNQDATANEGISQGDDNLQQQQRTSAFSKTSTNVTVHRDKISSTNLREDGDELGDLGVDVYDQQTYENSVFNQVDEAIEEAASKGQKKQNDLNRRQTSSKIDDLLRVVHGQSEDEDTEGDDQSAQDKDERVIQLARQARLNKQVKLEPIEIRSDDVAIDLLRIPKIPRTSTIRPKSEHSIVDSKRDIITNVPSTSSSYPVKQEPQQILQDDEILSSDFEDLSSSSEYKAPEQGNESSSPSDDDVDDLNEDIEYEPDSEPDEEASLEASEDKSKTIKDDGDFKTYAARVKAYTRAHAKTRLENILEDGTEVKKLDELVTIEGNLKIPKDIWDNLYEHQKTGLRWLWELHQLGTGGILGDEMGLGKTIEMIAFLIALRTSNIVDSHRAYKDLGPTVLVCPATVMHQWLVEFRKWYPQFRVAILHSTGSFSGDRRELIRVIHKSRGILICSFPGVIIYQDQLHNFDWHYAILDEGHKIRNPDAQVTLACKRFRTPHRIILSGSPVQNNLRELWSIFDFIYPGKLGTLPVFMGQFSIPITQGGYANATDLQVQIAFKCACVLRDTIKPFLLRRTKAEVNSKLKLPERSEQVLFCKLTEQQRKLYQSYLESPTVRDIKRGMCQIFVGLIQLRKICNHPDLFDSSECNRQIKETKLKNENKIKHPEFFSVDERYGHYMKSGKMIVVDALLKLWKKQGHKVLLFSQSRLMLKLFSNHLNEQAYKYLVMDGSSPIGLRHSLIDEFNNNDEIFIFLLTTRVGGVGVNLIGANRIIIYDPDWNPSTDIQARERAWRIGQQRHVVIYRLLTAGTIEEKIYHRQVFKLYLTNRVLRDAKQKRFFKTNDLHELFTLGNDDKNLETKALFDDDLQIDEKSIRQSKRKRKKKEKDDKKRKTLNDSAVSCGSVDKTSTGALSEQKLLEMRERAKRLSQMLVKQYATNHERSTNGRLLESQGAELSTNNGNFGEQKMSSSTSASVSNSFLGVASHDQQFLPNKVVPYRPAFGRAASASCTGDGSNCNIIRNETESTKFKLDYLVKQDIYKPEESSSTEKRSSESSDRYEHDDYILGRLFKNANIFGALKHDKIESDSTADFKVVESEAERVARDAIRSLRESRRMCLGSTSGIPNWTGQNGQLVRPRLVPKNKSRAQQLRNRQPVASSSSGANTSLLDSIRRRQQSNPVSLENNSSRNRLDNNNDSDEEEIDKDFVGTATGSGADKMADKIRDYLMYKSSNNGEAQTDEMLEFFKSNFTPDKTAIFKSILYKMCEFQRRADKGFWKLRSEFRDLPF